MPGRAEVPPTADAAFDLAGRVAVITGAGSGIGRASAIVLAERGADVVCADQDVAAAETTAAEAEQHGVRARARRVDVTDRAAVEALVDFAVRELGGLQVMANIAGINHALTPVLDVDEAELDRVLAVNFRGVLFGCQAAGAVMTDAGGGSIVNMASAAVDAASPGRLMYSISKVAVVQLTRTLAREVADRGVRVNAVAPGAVLTGMTRRHFADARGVVDPDRKAQWTAEQEHFAPLGIVGDPLDIAYAVLYLASDASRFVTGQILRPNGGIAMPW